jgi:hypothetical protein
MQPLERSLDFLSRTPATLSALLLGLEGDWIRANEGPATYDAFDVVGHLIHAEDDDWIPRIEHVLAAGEETPFRPFDREGMRRKYASATLRELLATFAARRAESLTRLRALGLTNADLARRGRHPELGTVTLGELLSTWVVHDLSHLAQIARVLAKARADEIGPWRAYFRVLSDRT